MRVVRVILLLLLPVLCNAQYMRTNAPNVRSLRMELNGDWNSLPVMTLGSDDVMQFSFDEMSHTYHRFTYRITHCNSAWEPSGLHEIDYLQGFNDILVEEWENSVNTTRLYTHYTFSLPNENVSLLLSGNYKVEVFDDELEEGSPAAVFCFSVVEPMLGVSAAVSGDTDVSFNDNHQQVSFTLDCSGVSIASPADEIMPVVYQNRRHDNAVRGIRPTYVTGNAIEYVHNEKLIFAAGNEYRRFELTHLNRPGMGVEETLLGDDGYHVLLYMDGRRTAHSSYIDENGRCYVNTHEGRGSTIEADYVHVHFALDVPYREGGCYYLLGDLCDNRFTQASRLGYDPEGGYYHTTQLLKLGLYNYMYVWLPDGKETAQTGNAEGDLFNTENEYLIYVYYRAFGERYDRLIGFSTVCYSLEHN